MSARPGSGQKELADESKGSDKSPAAPAAKPETPAPAEAKAEKSPPAEPKPDKSPPAPAEAKADKSPASEAKKEADKPAASAEKPLASIDRKEAEKPLASDVKEDAKEPAAPTEKKAVEQPIASAVKTAARPTSGGTRTVGINLSAAAKFTTLVAIEWKDDGAWVTEAVVDLEDDELIAYLASGDRTGVYAPFGWPVAMVEAVSSYTNSDQWQRASRRQFRHRETEGFVHDILHAETDQELWPQSVSCDRLALQARRMAQLREQLFAETGSRFDRAGGDHILEVYPPGASLLWGLNSHSANGLEIPPDASEKPGLLFIERLEAACPWLHWKEGKRGLCLKNEHTSDALLGALVARAAELDLTIRPENGGLEMAHREGWMHLPAKDSLAALAKAA